MAASCTGSDAETSASGESSQVEAMTGCLARTVEPLDHDGDEPASEIIEDARQYLNQRATTAELPYIAGELVWSKYGELGRDTAANQESDAPGAVWILVFETEITESPSGVDPSGLPTRWSALYRTDEGRVTMNCSARV